jgi:glycosyltransferase involved in cell wall biosynthesis
VRVLFTHRALEKRAGTELVTLELARGILDRGHQPIVYSTRLGAVAEEFRRATIPLVADLATLAQPPDLIHGQHHLDALTALLQFPGVPAIYVCHGWLPWEEAPLVFPRIRRYVAVDEATRDRIELEGGIHPERIETILNFVDLARFQPRSPLPLRPRRALVFSNQADESTHLPALRAACRGAGVELEVAGLAAGRPADRPWELLTDYDLVFAKGRSAMEAMAVGCAVVVCDSDGLAGMVTSADLDSLRRRNFGLRTLARPVQAAAVAAELARYDPVDAVQVSLRIRTEAGLDSAIGRYLDLYAQVVTEHRRLPAPSGEDESRATAAYLRGLGSGMRAQLEEFQGTLAWRLRQRLLRSPLLTRGYRWLRRLGS